MEIKDNALRMVKSLERAIEYTKRALLHIEIENEREKKSSLLGSVRRGDIADEMIEEAKKGLF